MKYFDQLKETVKYSKELDRYELLKLIDGVMERLENHECKNCEALEEEIDYYESCIDYYESCKNDQEAEIEDLEEKIEDLEKEIQKYKDILGIE